MKKLFCFLFLVIIFFGIRNEIFAVAGDVPPAPAGLTLSNVTSTSVKLDWTEGGVVPEDQFKIERSIDCGTFSQIATVGQNVLTYTDYSAISGTQNNYRVRASNIYGNSSYSSVASVITPSSSAENIGLEGGTIIYNPETGAIFVGVPPGAFSGTVSITVSTASAPSSSDPKLKIANIGISITKSTDDQPKKKITIRVLYRDSDLPAGFDERKLAIALYDTVKGIWIPLPSTVDTVQNIVTATTDHLSTFAIVQLAPSADLAGTKAYPNPFNPQLSTLSISNLTASSEIRIYNVAGEPIRKLDYSGSGLAGWDGKNASGSVVASGVYILYIRSDSGTKKIKVAVEK